MFLKNRGIDDPRLRLRVLHVSDVLRNKNIPFLLSRLDDDARLNTVQFLSSRVSFATAQQILDFCTALVSKFSSQPRRLFFDISATVDTTDENHHAAMEAMDKMMRKLSTSGSITLYENNLAIRKWT
jgi:hypothetical protein